LVFLVLGSIGGFLSVALGAFGAHILKQSLSADSLAVFQTGVQYQMYHALALVLVGIFTRWTDSPWLTWSGILFTAGIVLFSGSLYLLSMTGTKTLGAITPIGGICFLAGWAFLLIAGTKSF